MSKEKRMEDATKIIEDICAHAALSPSAEPTELEEELNNALSDIYKIAHVSREPSCMSVHDNWEEDFNRIRKREGLIED